MTAAPYPRRQLVVIPSRNISAPAARFRMTVAELLDYHLAHGGRVNDRNGDWLCWPIVPDDAEADA